MKIADTGHGLSLWIDRQTTLQRLGCSARTLRRKVERGEVERKRSGRRTLYRINGGHRLQKRPEIADTGQHRSPIAASKEVVDVAADADLYAAIAALLVLIGEVRDELKEAKAERAELKAELAQLRKESTRPRRRLVASAKHPGK